MDNSPFQRLPAQLRNEIWKQAIGTKQDHFSQPSWTQACRQMRSETRPIFHRSHFTITVDIRRAGHIAEWIDDAPLALISKMAGLTIVHESVQYFNMDDYESMRSGWRDLAMELQSLGLEGKVQLETASKPEADLSVSERRLRGMVREIMHHV